MTVQTEIRSSEAVFGAVLPGGPALDLTAARFDALTAEVQQLRIELLWTKVALDDLGDEAAPLDGEILERLTVTAQLDRLHTPRARHAGSSRRSGVVSWLAHLLHRAEVTA